MFRRNKIGLVGYNCDTGLGTVNDQLATYTEIDHWLVRPHRMRGVHEFHPACDCESCPTGAKVERWLTKVDTVLFVETPYYTNLIEHAVNQGKRIVCVPMQEWLNPEELWTKYVDLFICPNKYCYNQFKDVLPCTFFPWPFCIDSKAHRLRTKVDSFLFINGHGGYLNRKGADAVKEAIKLWPDFPLFIRSQKSETWPQGSKQLIIPPLENAYELYSQGDVLLCPHSMDGLGLEPMEAMVAGMPVILTDGKPWDELPTAFPRIKSTVKKVYTKRHVDWYAPSPEHIVEVCKSLLGTDIEEASVDARAYAEIYQWENHASQFNEMVRHGVPTNASNPTTNEVSR